ncbi:hypothetical protein OAK82_03115 [Candidatus Thioglobus sp.]|nr:hypothetical protein [Candidatus Thioglobus sp.]
MGKYIRKNHKEDEKRVVSVRIRRPVFEAFKGASLAAQKYGYSMSLSAVFETALEDAITEFKEISGVDFHEIEKTNLHEEWEKKYEAVLKTTSKKSHKIDNTKKGRGEDK